MDSLKVNDRVCVRIRLDPCPRNYRDTYLYWNYDHAVKFDGQFATIREVKESRADVRKYLVDFDEPIQVENVKFPYPSFHFDYREVIRLD